MKKNGSQIAVFNRVFRTRQSKGLKGIVKIVYVYLSLGTIGLSFNDN